MLIALPNTRHKVAMLASLLSLQQSCPKLEMAIPFDAQSGADGDEVCREQARSSNLVCASPP